MEIKCRDTQCERRNLCRRFTEPEEAAQQYFPKSPRWNNECDLFISNGKSIAEQREDAIQEKQSFMEDVLN
jgi:hypothetical protein